MQVIILAGGSGSRLWPLSRELFPKYLLPLANNNQTLFQATIHRYAHLNCSFKIITNTDINDNYLLAQLSIFNNLDISVIKEPHSRNTTAALILALLKIDKENQNADDIILVSPCDHLIDNLEKFVESIEIAKKVAEKGYIITFGITPTNTETSFGYIKRNDEKLADQIFKVQTFKEKPDAQTVTEFVNDKNYYWNSGILMAKKSVILNELIKFAPRVFNDISKYLNLTDKKLAKKIYSKIENIPIEYSILEKSDKLAVCISDFGWNAIACWKEVFAIKPKNKNHNCFEANVFTIDSKNNYIYSKDRLITAIGLNNMVVIDTRDALLICNLDKTQEVKNIYNLLKQRALPEYQNHLIVEKPWGSYCVLEEGLNFKVKRITVKPQQQLSLQAHNQRSEHWVVVKGIATVINGSQELTLKENEHTFIPAKVKHRLSNKSNTEMLEIIETQYGEYLGEDDIIRFEDIYNRITDL